MLWLAIRVMGLLVVLAVISGRSASRAQSPAPDTDAIAQEVVSHNLGITAGEMVLITGPVREIRFLEDLAFHVRRVGAFPLLNPTSDRLVGRIATEVPASYNETTDAFQLALMDVADVWLVVAPDIDPGVLSGVPPERLAAQDAALDPIIRRFRERGVRFLEIGNGLYPVEWRVAGSGVSTEDLSKAFWGGMSVDHAELERSGQRVRDRLESGREVRVTHPNGTNIQFRIGGRPIFVNDGVISADDRARGGAALSVWLPAGEAYTTAIPGTAAGVLVNPHSAYLADPAESSEILNLRIEFREGRVQSMTGDGPGFANYRARYAAAGEGRDAFGVLDIGLNPNIHLPEGSQLGSFLPVGGVTLAFGNDVWAGGDNDVTWGEVVFLQGATVTVDGEPLVVDGRLMP